MPSKIVATGHYYPRDIVDNEEFIRRAQFELPDLETLAVETKMKTRTWCGPEESTWTMSRAAVDVALDGNPDLGDKIDLVIVTSASTLPCAHVPEPETPAMADLAPLIVDHLGRQVLGLDLRSVACTGFLRGLQVADAMLATGSYRAALVVAAEATSRLAVGASNRSGFCYILSDGAGAAVLEPTGAGERSGLVDHFGYTDGAKRGWMVFGDDLASLVVRGSKVGPASLSMLIESGRVLLERNDLKPADVDWLLPVQSHAGMIEGLRQELDWPEEKLLWHGDVKGFSGSSSIPACLSFQLAAGKVKPGDLVLAVAVGAGLNCAGSLFYV